MLSSDLSVLIYESVTERMSTDVVERCRSRQAFVAALNSRSEVSSDDLAVAPAVDTGLIRDNRCRCVCRYVNVRPSAVAEDRYFGPHEAHVLSTTCDIVGQGARSVQSQDRSRCGETLEDHDFRITRRTDRLCGARTAFAANDRSANLDWNLVSDQIR